MVFPSRHSSTKRIASTGGKVTCEVGPHKLLYSERRQKNRGQELVEFAIMLPLLILLVIGVLDLGRVFFSAITIANAAREGTRYAISHGLYYDLNTDTFLLKTTEIRDQVKRDAADSGLNLVDSDISVSCPNPLGCGPGRNIRVLVSYQFDILLDFFLPSVTINRQAEMMVP